MITFQKVQPGTAYNESVQTFQASVQVPVAKDCFAWALTNLGTGIVRVNGHILFPSATPATVAGDTWTEAAPGGQIYKGKIDISFTLPVGVAPLVELTQLFYLDSKKINE